MKKINLIEWLSRNSHEKQSPQRFARYAAMLITLLTLGVGQMWADPWVKLDVSTGSQGTKTVGDAISGSDWWFNYQTNGGWSTGTDIQVLIGTSTSSYSTVDASWYADDGSNKKVHANIGSFEFDKSGIWYAVGKYTAGGTTAYTSGTSFTNNTSLSTSMSKSNSPYWTVNPPAVSSFSVARSGYLAGSGTSEDPYLVASGSTLTLTGSGSQAISDANSSVNYKFGSDAYSTTATKNITVTSSGSIAVKARCINSSASLNGTETSAITIYYAPVSVKDISVYIYVGGHSEGEINSVEMNGCTPYVGTKALAAVKINNRSAGDPKFTLSGNWLIYTFTNVTKVSGITCARTGDNIFTGQITDNVYYTYDGAALPGQCIQPANPTWGTAPASGAIGGSMTASVSGAPAGATITWTSTNTSAATVNSSGVISYVAVGNTTIKANVSWSASGDYCAGSYELSQAITVTSGATVSATRACPEYVSTNSGQVKLDISSTGASTGWYYRVCNSTKTAYYAPEEQSAASNVLSWTMNGSLPTGANTLVVELYNSARQLVCTSSPVTVNVEIAESVTISAGANGSVSPSGTVYANNNHVHPTITATPDEHYQFVNWASSNAAASVADANNATTTVTATASGCTITANFAGDQYTITYKDQGDVAYSGNNEGSLPATHTYGTTTALVNGTKNGYNFVGWYTDASCTVSAGSSIGATAKTSDFTLYAKWTEVMTTVTINVNPASAGTLTLDGNAFTPGNTTTAGVSTSHTVMATAKSGNVFLNWSTSGNATGSSVTNTYTLHGNGNGTTGTLTANFGVSTGWYLEGTDFDGWGGDNCSSLPTSYPFAYPYRDQANTYYIPVTLNSGSYFKVHKGDGCSNVYNFGTNSSNVTVSKNTVYSLTEDATHSGTVSTTMSNVWAVLNTSTKKFWVQDSKTYYTITLANGSSGDTGNGVAGTEGTVTLTTNDLGNLRTKQFASGERVNISVSAQSGYYIDDITIGGNSVATDVNAASYSGYTTMPASNTTLTVTYKRIYTVTYGVGTSYTSMGGVSTSPSISSGDYVIEGTSITFTATPNPGYKFVGWYREAACTNQISTDNPYTFSVTAAKTVYAKFELMDIKINADLNGLWPVDWVQYIMSHSSGSPAIYTYSTTLTTRATEDGAAPFNSGYHFNFLASNNEPLYNYDGVQTPTYSGSSIDGVRKTADGNPTIQFGLTRKSDVTITLTLQTPPTKPTLNIEADPYFDITYTAPSHGSYTIQVGAAAPVSANTEARAGTTITLANTPSTGYHFGSWTVAKSAGTVTVSNNQFTMPSEDVTVSTSFTPNTYQVQFHRNGASEATVYQDFTYDAPQNLTANTYTRTGYNFAGWALSTSGEVEYTNGANVSNLTSENGATFHLYAKWTPNPYTVVLDKQTSAEGYGSEGTVGDQTVTFDATPATVSGTMPSAANGYAFMGFYSATGGNGRLFIDPSGNWVTSAGDTISGGNWVKPAGITLYAYYKKAEITDVELNETMFDPVAAGDEGYVVANPTIAPNPTGDHIICWELLYDNDNPVTGHDAIADPDGSHLNRIKFSIAGLAAGGYKIRTTLRTGSSCAGGTLLDTRVTKFQIANAFTVTVEYKDNEGNTIAASTTSPGKALESTDITAPDLIGYTFSTWQLGEGMSTEEALTTKTDFSYKTTFNSTLTAVYTKKRMIYFNNTLGWESVYVYFYKNDSYWETAGDKRGSGSKTTSTWTDTPYSEGLHGQMLPISEGSNIYYFDAEAEGVPSSYDDVVFTEDSQHDYEFFHKTNAVRRGDYKTSLPMFVPVPKTEQTADVRNETNYYNHGYWMNYPENTGYVLHIYNSTTYGASDELMSIPFEYTADKTMPMSLTVELAGGKEYGFEIHRADSKIYGTNTKVMKNGDSGDDGTGWALAENKRTGLLTSVAGDYTFTLNYGNSGGYNFLAGVHYPVAANDYRVVYNDRVDWSQGTAHSASWYHPSRAIEKKDGAEDIVSFYVSKEEGASASMKFQYASSVSGEGVVTWSDVDGGSISLSDITESGVYNFYLSQAAGSITVDSIRPYTGQYYIRSQAVSGGWDNYRVGSDHKMTYSEFSESAANTFGEKFSHYKAKWCPRNTNIAFTIANDYSMCITDTLKQDVGNPYSNTDADGKLNNDGNPGHDGSNAYLDPNSANVRFMWNRKTNKISRAYVASSTSSEAKFLVLQGSGTANANIFDENGSALSANPPGANATLLRDDQNWIYEITVQANPSALVKLYANYKEQTQYFRGTSDAGFEKGTSAVELLGGTSSSTKYSVRVVYDFKTNRLVTAWQPTGATQEINGELNINADVMVIRKHHESAQCITFANDESALKGVKTVYGVMQFNRWILNNREHPEDDTPEHCADLSAIATHHRPLAIGDQKSIYERSHYYISFPFDVRLSDVFGFGQYWNEWYIEWYDGLTRAQNGYWIDSPSNWKYVTPEEKDNFVLKANQGYILGLDMDYMQATDFSFWSNKNTTIELYFPSTVSLETLKSTQVTIPALNTIEGDPYRCTINRENGDDGDRRIKDSYWRCIGVPSFNIYNSALEDEEGNMIEWKDDYEWKEDDAAFPFIYLWNKADNTITPQATSEFSFQPMHAYLVQNGGAIVWSAVSAKPSSIVARQRNTEPEEYNWRLELQQNNQMIDRTYIRMKDLESVTDGFDFGQDMSKEFNKKRSAIFSFIGTEKVAANSMPVHTDQTTIVPLGLDIKSAGEYVISLPEGTNGVGVVLVDSITGTRTNLGLMDYEVSLTAGKIDNRFLLEISPIMQTPTDIENVQGDNVQGTKVRKVMVDGILYIVKDGKVYDARGNRVK